jgi:hypothetical protein
MNSTMTMPRLVMAACLAACSLWGCGGGSTNGSGGGPAADTTAPSTVTGLAASATSATQINLTWTAATDNVGVTGYRVERCSGAACTNFTQVATPATASYSDTGLTGATAYSYRVKAVDAAGNVSASYSAEASATTQTPPDTTPPSTVSGLAATAASATQINLTWTAATDNAGVTGYRVERCSGAACASFAQIATPATTSYSDTGLTASTAYSYRVKAVDAAGNASTSYSTEASATTQAPPATGSLAGTVVSLKTKLPVAGVQVSVGARTTTTAADGVFTLTGVPAGDNVLVHIDPPPASFAENFRQVRVRANATTDLTGLAVVPTGTTVAVNVATGATINVGTVGRVVISPNSLVPKAGGTAATTVNVSVTPLSAVNDPETLPGEFTVAVAGGVMQPFRSFGALLVDLRDANGVHYTLAPGATASIRIPVGTLQSPPYPATLPLLSFNESTGKWVEEPGVLTLDAGGTYYEGTVTHFTSYGASNVAGCLGAGGIHPCQPTGPHDVFGRVVTPDGTPIANALVKFLGVNHSGYNGIYTDANGEFSFVFQSGEVSLVWAVDSSGSTRAYVVDGTTRNSDLYLGDIKIDTDRNNIRVTTTWNRVDSMRLRPLMEIPEPGTSEAIGGPDGGSSLTASPFGLDQLSSTLQYDVMTVRRFFVGRYQYFIEQTTGGSITNAQTRVRTELGATPTAYFSPPPAEPFNADWHVFDFIVAQDCSVQVIPVNEWVRLPVDQPASPPDGPLCTPP